MPETSLPAKSGLVTLDYLAIAVYMCATFGIAVWFGRKQKSVDDYFIGGRRMPWFAVGLSILATLFSTLSYVGGPGEIIRHGIGMFVGNLAVPFNIAVVTLLWIPFFMRLKVTSAYEYLERRFSYPVRLIGALLFVLLRLGWMSMVVYAAAMCLQQVAGTQGGGVGNLTDQQIKEVYWWIAGVGLFAAIYTATGGIQAMIWTDVLQCLLLLAGVVMTIAYVAVVDHTGPADWWQTATEHAPAHTSPPFFTTDVTVRNTIVWVLISNFFWTISTHGSDQVVLQRYFSTASLSAARRSYLINVVVDVSMSVLLSFAGLALLAFYLRHSDRLPDNWTPVNSADKLFPFFLGHQLPAGCAGLIVSAFICDAMQTLESGVNAITAVVTNDIVPRLRRGKPRIMSELTFARVLTVVITLFVTRNAFYVAEHSVQGGQTLVTMMPKFFNMFVGPLAALFIIGMFLPRCTARSAIPAALVGMTVSFGWSWFRWIADHWKWFENLFPTKSEPTVFLAIAVPCLTTIATAAVLGLIVEKGGQHAGRNFTWMAIVKGRKSEQTEPGAG